MFWFKVLITLVVCLSWSDCKLDKYCSICADHTMCKYHGIGEQCEDVGGSGVSDQDMQEILGVHNWLRRMVATGHETRGIDGPQPEAANLRKLVWDNELSVIAQRWADQCLFQHDTCRAVERWRVGQNIYWKWKYPTHETNWTEAIMSWYDEVAKFRGSEVESYRFDMDTGHYTQLVWHSTSTIGCGRRDYGLNKIYVCNYGPTGNWLRDPVYAVGEPCSRCPFGTFCDEFLCAQTSHRHEVPPDESIVKSTENHTAPHFPAQSEATGNNEGTNTLDATKISNRNGDFYSHEPEKIGFITPNHTLLDFLNFFRSGSSEQKSTTNAIDEENITLDPETNSAIEEIMLKIQKLVQNVIKKLKSQQ